MSIYLKNILQSVPRILNQLDKKKNSPTFGCFDRDYWLYKTVDFPCARKQEAALTLALLYTLNEPKNRYFQKEEIKEYAVAAIKFWISQFSKKKSFDEWYPYENSFVATAFSSYAITEAILELSLHLRKEEKVILHKIALFLNKNKEHRVQNQQAGAIAALYNFSIVLSNSTYAKACQRKMKALRSKQSEEGWFEEYNGPDIGYLSLATDYLVKYHSKSQDKQAQLAVEKAYDFISFFLHPDHTVGGPYASRNTQYLIPSAFEGSNNRYAKRIAQFCRTGITKGTLINCQTIDDRYLLYNGYTYLQAHKKRDREIKKHSQRFEKEFEKEMTKCGIIIKNTKKYFCIINTRKGGAFYFYSKKRKKAVLSSGLFIEHNEKIFTNSYIGSSQRIASKNKKVTIRSKMQRYSSLQLSPSKMIASRLFQMTLGRNKIISKSIKNLLRNILITPTKQSKITALSIIEFEKDSMKIESSISKGKFRTKDSVSYQPFQVVPSSNYHITSETYKPTITIKNRYKKCKIVLT